MAWAKILLPWQVGLFFHVHLIVELTTSQVLLHRPKQMTCHEMCFCSMTQCKLDIKELLQFFEEELLVH
jgi:hypothetical protein